MGTTTTRLELFKPDPDPVTGDDVDVTDLNDNADKIDAAVGFFVCSSGTRPSTPWQGQGIMETDTGLFYVWGGSAWVRLVNLNASGHIVLGGDANLYRSAANVLKTDDELVVVGDITAAKGRFGGSSGAAVYIGDDGILVDVNTANMIGVQGQSASTSGGFVFGSGADTNLYRGAANQLKTDDTFVAANVIAGDTGWTTPSLNTGWSNFGGGWAPTRYRKTINGVVHIEGLLTGPASPSNIFQLASGYRPSSHLMFAGIGDGVATRVDVLSDGSVNWATGGSTGYFTISCSFYVG